MSKRCDESQFDLDLSGDIQRAEAVRKAPSAHVMPFVDAATLQIRRDALRRVTANGIFQLPPSLRRG